MSELRLTECCGVCYFNSMGRMKNHEQNNSRSPYVEGTIAWRPISEHVKLKAQVGLLLSIDHWNGIWLEGKVVPPGIKLI